MRFVFNERRAAQAAAHLLKRNGGEISYMVLIKLLYYADRKSLIRIGRPITGDSMFSMKNGPVLSTILDLIHMGKRDRPSVWFEYVSEPSNYTVSLIKQNPETDELSKYELNMLDEVFEEFGSVEKWDLVEMTHQLPEWHDPDRSSIAIEPETILASEGKDKSEIERVGREAVELLEISKLECSAL